MNEIRTHDHRSRRPRHSVAQLVVPRPSTSVVVSSSLIHVTMEFSPISTVSIIPIDECKSIKKPSNFREKKEPKEMNKN